jgi:hypothetical protein
MFRWLLEYLSLRRKDNEDLINNGQLAINSSMKENTIAIKTYQFAIQIINLSKELNSKKEFVLSRQILKSGLLLEVMSKRQLEVFQEKILELKCQYHIRKQEKTIIG